MSAAWNLGMTRACPGAQEGEEVSVGVGVRAQGGDGEVERKRGRVVAS